MLFRSLFPLEICPSIGVPGVPGVGGRGDAGFGSTPTTDVTTDIAFDRRLPYRDDTMSKIIHDSVIGAIGATPLVALDRLAAGLPGRVVAKLEFYGPGASVKDRVARAVIDDAEARGVLKPGGTVVELTSGNMGTGLAVVCAVRGYRMIAVMSAGNSIERRRMLEALGAEVALVPQVPGLGEGALAGVWRALPVAPVEVAPVELAPVGLAPPAAKTGSAGIAARIRSAVQ